MLPRTEVQHTIVCLRQLSERTEASQAVAVTAEHMRKPQCILEPQKCRMSAFSGCAKMLQSTRIAPV
jgi:hypothetical protein